MPLDDTVLPLPYKEVMSHQIAVICKELFLKLIMLNRHGKNQLVPYRWYISWGKIFANFAF